MYSNVILFCSSGEVYIRDALLKEGIATAAGFQLEMKYSSVDQLCRSTEHVSAKKAILLSEEFKKNYPNPKKNQ